MTIIDDVRMQIAVLSAGLLTTYDVIRNIVAYTVLTMSAALTLKPHRKLHAPSGILSMSD